MDSATLKLVTFSFILSIIFPTFAYTFTTFGEEPENFDISLTVDQLINSGVILSDAVSHNVTYLGGAQEYTVKNTTMRIAWKNNIITGSYFANQQQSLIELWLGTWIYPIEMDWVHDQSVGFLPSQQLKNATVVNKFDPQYNWTKYELVQNGLTVFITTLASDDNNISKAIYETGTVTITVGTPVFAGQDINFENFGKWYMSVVTGQGDDWGLPAFMSWVVRIFSFMTFLAGILLLKEFVPFLN